MQYKNHIIMSSDKDKENVKQNVAMNLWMNEIEKNLKKMKLWFNKSKKTNDNVQPNFIRKSCKKLNRISIQYKFAYQKYTVLRIKNSLEDSTYIAICFS